MWSWGVSARAHWKRCEAEVGADMTGSQSQVGGGVLFVLVEGRLEERKGHA